ncbi:MAG: hypothetical protein ACO2PP_18910 [Thermocrinis sp.]
MKKINLYSEHYKEKVRFEEMYYGVLVMVVCDSEGVVYDLCGFILRVIIK